MEVHPDWSLFSGVGPTPTIYDERNNTFSTTENTAPSSFYPLMYSGYGLIDDCHMEVIMDYEGINNTYETYMMAKELDNLNFIGPTSYNNKVMLYERRAGNWINPGVETPVVGTIGQLVEMDVVGDQFTLTVNGVVIGSATHGMTVSAHMGILLRGMPIHGQLWHGMNFTGHKVLSGETSVDIDHDGKRDAVIVKDSQGNPIVTVDSDSVNIDIDGDGDADIIIPR